MNLRDLHRAVHLACLAHNGHDDRNGVPYIYHLFYVSDRQVTLEGKIVGLLHDSVEDGKLRISDIECEFGAYIAECVAILTRGESESYNSYIRRVMQCELTMYVKLADIEHNTLIERMDEKAAKRFPMYQEAYASICERLGIPNRFVISVPISEKTLASVL